MSVACNDPRSFVDKLPNKGTFSAAFFNTLFFMTLLVLFFGSTEKLAGPIAEKGVLMYIITSVGINAVVELIVAAVVTGAAGVALKKARML